MTPPPTATPYSTQWHYEIAPYIWASAIKGQATVDGHAVSATIPFNKILSDLQFAAMVHLEASNGPWSLMLDPLYVKLTKNVAFGTRLTSELTLVDTGVFYKLLSTQMKYNQSASFELLAGARYFGLDNEIDFPFNITVIDNTQLITPIVGARAKYRISKVQLWARGDIGGFHVDKIDKTWSWTAGLGYAITPCADIGVAYRVLQIDYNGSFNSKMKTRLYGPMLGFSIHD